MQSRICPSGLATMPSRSTVGNRVGVRPVRALTLSETRLPLPVIATGRPEKPTVYRGVQYHTGQKFVMDPLDVPDLEARGLVQVVEDLPATDWWGRPGRILQMEPGEGVPYAREASPGALKIVQGTGYDPGNAVYRFHSAINEHTKHTNAFVRYLTRDNNPFRCPTQYDAMKERALVRSLLLEADVVHTHINNILTIGVGFAPRPRPGQLIVKHYHGTQFDPKGHMMPEREQVPRAMAESDDAVGYVLLGARLTLCALRPGRIQWLPITVPVDRYRGMVTRSADEWPRRPFRVAHSPTKAILKGTREFLQVCKRLRARGIPIEPVMIERKHHDAALSLKATCDACFDSFALGIQGSGLEAAAMGQPVIAGDPSVAQLYTAEFGHVPYTYAPTWQGLERELERLATDQDYYRAEAQRVGEYVRTVHDYPAVARRYEDILARALGREDVRTTAPASMPKRSHKRKTA